MIGKAYDTVGWRYPIAEAPSEPANHPPETRRKERLEFLDSAVAFGPWEIPYHAIARAQLFAPGMALQILRLTTNTDVFEFVVGRGRLPSNLPFGVTPMAASPGGELDRGLRRVRLAVIAAAAVAAAVVIWLLRHAA